MAEDGFTEEMRTSGNRQGQDVSSNNVQEQVTGCFPEPECTNPPISATNLAERQISGGPKAGALPVKDYNACTIENNTRPP